MPIVILLDVSLSMSRPVPADGAALATTGTAATNNINNGSGGSGGRLPTRATLAAAGVNALLDHLAANSRLEFAALVVFSSLYEVLCGFTRDYDAIRQKLRLDEFDKTCLESALVGAYHLVLAEWGNQTHTHIVLVTDGCVSSTLPGPPPVAPFPCTLHILCVASPTDPALPISNPIYRRLMEVVNGNSSLNSIYLPEQNLSLTSVTAMFRRFCNEQIAPWRGVLRCGSLDARIILAPAPLPHAHVTDFDSTKLVMMNSLEICGFISMQDIGSPMALSRHLLLPAPPATLALTKTPSTVGKGESDIPTSPDEDSSDVSKIPNLCVLLHGALKVENLAGVVQLGEDWYGLVHSWADSKKKSNLMLSVLPPGDDAVPWLGPISQLGATDQMEMTETFPVRVAERKSYSSASGGGGGGSVWVHPAGLQTDLQKLLRHARKLPDKLHHFYKEVNRVRRAALALGWVEALEAAAGLLEREAPHLVPDAVIPLTVAIRFLRNTTDPKLQLPHV